MQFQNFLIVLQIDTLQQIQKIPIQNDFVFIGNDSINKIQIFKQATAIILFKLFNTSLINIIQQLYDTNQFKLVYQLDINYFNYNPQSIQLATENQSVTFGLQKENIVTINNDINYISIYDSISQLLVLAKKTSQCVLERQIIIFFNFHL
ncbi:hypothetical protein TTHERM_00988290 (macronuclear) [Tetrahymena thermophila SB210]|uniref:Uncharacterized protein n=1 Tax=Tetrahymena thermophila (strain SB210) TaxID=312017 RepID=Q233U6_TETTS|nr:hypothetical protein TTHERM_00988290 [Tetrahymena thermophila SB210]EAR91838.3 hypothetical protein TTHERM_00988290 [Tetrahymena thermophila SB210]|eukprot:XP_001012083.3 hypothetical protein TTHERM_00988290 [Tetrahymena thermophila SB210]